jgi:hypothetical protein
MLKELIEDRNGKQNEVYDRVHDFLVALDKAGHHAPTVSELRRADQTIKEITVEGDQVVLEVVTSYSQCGDETEYLRYPLATVEDPSEVNITAFIESERLNAESAQRQKDAMDISEAKGALWSPVQKLKRLGVTLKDILSQAEAHYNWVDPKAAEKK